MLSPTIREDLVRLRQIELARQVERSRGLATAPQTASPRRVTSVLLALLHRRTTRPASAYPQDSLGFGDRPFAPLRVVDGERHAP
jgi:hypothetical protein